MSELGGGRHDDDKGGAERGEEALRRLEVELWISGLPTTEQIRLEGIRRALEREGVDVIAYLRKEMREQQELADRRARAMRALLEAMGVAPERAEEHIRPVGLPKDKSLEPREKDGSERAENPGDDSTKAKGAGEAEPPAEEKIIPPPVRPPAPEPGSSQRGRGREDDRTHPHRREKGDDRGPGKTRG